MLDKALLDKVSAGMVYRPAVCITEEPPTEGLVGECRYVKGTGLFIVCIGKNKWNILKGQDVTPSKDACRKIRGWLGGRLYKSQSFKTVQGTLGKTRVGYV